MFVLEAKQLPLTTHRNRTWYEGDVATIVVEQWEKLLF